MKLEGDYRKMTKKGAETIANKTADYLRMNIQTYDLIWKTTLLNSINVKPLTRTQLGINMVFYGFILEKGHLIPAGIRLPTLVGWAREKLGPYAEAWLKKVYKYGHPVFARPFISDAMDAIEPQIPSIMKENLRQVR